MKKRTIYTCEKCGLKIEEDYQQMITHEYSHVVPNVQIPEANIYDVEYPYPLKITVTMSNGAKVEYVNPSEVEPPTEKESPSETD